MSIEVIILGSAQDGGIPHAGCNCDNCLRAHEDQNLRQFVSCLGIIDRENNACWMIDATPDFREQLHMLMAIAENCNLKGIFLTHAHMGHYTGLMHLGKEAMHANNLPVYCTKSMQTFLASNAPWNQLIEIGNIELRNAEDDEAITLSSKLSILPISVPHRSEYSDTLAYQINGPGKTLFYCPDIDSWEKADFDFTELLQRVDIALLDGTFFDEGELKGREISEVPHPLIKQSVESFKGVESDIRFIHLNHTNPVWQRGPERTWLDNQGFGVAEQGLRTKL